jgi:hypothetical protein
MKLNLLIIPALLIASFNAFADVPVTKADILGAWQIDKESTHSDGSDSRPQNTVWTFREDGTMEGVSNETEAHARINQLRAVLNYSVENGKVLKQAAAGRSKIDTCSAVEKEGNKMVLKCSSSYFFMTKK